MKDGRTGHSELLVARSNEGGKEICRRVRSVSKDEE